MAENSDYISNNLNSIILNTTEPFIIKNRLNWKLLSWTLEDWEKVLQSEKLNFRCGKKDFTKEPQWERTTHSEHLSFEEFLQFTKTDSNKWMYFDYKYLNEWFKNCDELQKTIDWSMFGFNEVSGEDSTIWIGSEGAHTPCHIDTYGCNLVAQLYGRKQWILFPPHVNLQPTRIPYEESSIYSKLNFYSPQIADFKDIDSCRMIILEPGDVLVIPHGWWHYVENLETAISINAWIPLAIDKEERLKEAIIQFFVSQISKNLSTSLKEEILNPNADLEIENLDTMSSITLISECKRDIIQSKPETHESTKMDKYFQENFFLQKIPVCSHDDFIKFLDCQCNRFCDKSQTSTFQNTNEEELFRLIDVFTNPENVQYITNKYLNN